MGISKGRPKKGQLVDMSAPLAPEPAFGLPPPDECEEPTLPPIYLGDTPGNQLRCRFRLWLYNYAIVEFAITQVARVNGRWTAIVKIDTCRGVVHYHRYDRATGLDIYDHRPLETIPAIDGWDVITRWYDRALVLMEKEWEENLRRWRHD